MKNLFTASFISALSIGGAALADSGLYQDVADPESSFVRVIAPGHSIASIDGENIQGITQGISGFVNVDAGDIEVSVPSGKSVILAGQSTHYTAVFMNDDAPVFVTDLISNSASKADVSLYNLTDVQSINLFVPAAKAVAIEEIGPKEGKSVAIKAPLTLDLEIRANEKVLATISQVDLIRRSGVSIVLVQQGDSFSAVATPNTYFK